MTEGGNTGCWDRGEDCSSLYGDLMAPFLGGWSCESTSNGDTRGLPSRSRELVVGSNLSSN